MVRSDLKNIDGNKIRTGKIAAQCCHASISFIVKNNKLNLSKVEADWVANGMTKICVCVESEDALHKIHASAKNAGIESHIIKDYGKTEFKEPTYTCLALGPDFSSKIDKITGDLKLL